MINKKNFMPGHNSEPGEVSISIIGASPLPNPIAAEDMLLAGLRDIALGYSGDHLTALANSYLKEELPLPEQSSIDHPDHYRAESGLEAIEVIEAWDLNFNMGNAIKYICRAGLKNSGSRAEDLEKAIWYLSREVQTKG
jgi:hypothetical protein